MSKNILIDTTNNIETRIAVTDDGKLDDFEIETNKKNAVKGDVYLAKITRIEPSLQAAFVDFGTNRNGFLPLTEIHPDYFKIPAADEEKEGQARSRGGRSRGAEEQVLSGLGLATAGAGMGSRVEARQAPILAGSEWKGDGAAPDGPRVPRVPTAG